MTQRESFRFVSGTTNCARFLFAIHWAQDPSALQGASCHCRASMQDNLHQLLFIQKQRQSLAKGIAF